MAKSFNQPQTESIGTLNDDTTKTNLNWPEWVSLTNGFSKTGGFVNINWPISSNGRQGFMKILMTELAQ